MTGNSMCIPYDMQAPVTERCFYTINCYICLFSFKFCENFLLFGQTVPVLNLGWVLLPDELFLLQARRLGTYCQSIWETRPSSETVLENSWRRFCLQRTNAYCTLEVPQLCAIQFHITLHYTLHYLYLSTPLRGHPCTVQWINCCNLDLRETYPRIWAAMESLGINMFKQAFWNACICIDVKASSTVTSTTDRPTTSRATTKTTGSRRVDIIWCRYWFLMSLIGRNLLYWYGYDERLLQQATYHIQFWEASFIFANDVNGFTIAKRVDRNLKNVFPDHAGTA